MQLFFSSAGLAKSACAGPRRLDRRGFDEHRRSGPEEAGILRRAVLAPELDL